MKTNIIKTTIMSLAFMLVFSVGIMAMNNTSEDKHHNAGSMFINHEDAEPEMEIEAWMTSTEEYYKMASFMKRVNTIINPEEQNSEVVPRVEPWMSDITHFMTNGNRLFKHLPLKQNEDLNSLSVTLK
jgi:hypothetical protein